VGDDPKTLKVRVDSGGWMGAVWFGGWLYTIGWLHLVMPQALYALAIWPYYVGRHFAH
jgi:hypothetical protein